MKEKRMMKMKENETMFVIGESLGEKG